MTVNAKNRGFLWIFWDFGLPPKSLASARWRHATNYLCDERFWYWYINL